MVYLVVGFAGKNTAGAYYYVDLLHVRRILCCSLEYHPTGVDVNTCGALLALIADKQDSGHHVPGS